MWVKGGLEGQGRYKMMHSYFTLEIEENLEVLRMVKKQCKREKMTNAHNPGLKSTSADSQCSDFST